MLRPSCSCQRHVPLPPSPAVLTWPTHSERPFETGIELNAFLSNQLEGVVVEALQDNAVQAELKNTVIEVIDDPAVRTALRPYIIEAVIGLGLAITGGIVIGRAVTQRMG